MQKKASVCHERLGKVGGQAVMEGVMMRSQKKTAIAVRRTEDGKIVVRLKDTKSIKDKHKILKLPIIRGIVGFVESLVSSFGTLTESTEMLGLDLETDENSSKFDKWLTEKLGDKVMTVVTGIGMVLGVALALVLFIWLPAFIAGFIPSTAPEGQLDLLKCVADGFIKIAIFIAYIYLTSLIPDIKRVYMYHGSEHKSIACYEAGDELTVENVKKHTRFHPRCGTSFMFVILIISIIVNSLILWAVGALFPLAPINVAWFKALIKIIALPIVVGISYEYIMYAGKHDNTFTHIFSAPGLWMQRITTREPDDDMIEVAITSIKSALPEVFTDFDIPFEIDEAQSEISDQSEETVC